MLVKHISETPHPVESLRPDVPPALAQAVMRALAKKPEQRWSDAAEFRTAILDPRPSRPVSAPPADERPAPQPQSARDESHASSPPPPAFYQSPFTGPAHAPPRPSRPAEAVASPELPALPPMPALPSFGSRADWREWRKLQRRWDEERRHRERMALKSRRRADELDVGRPVAERVSSWRRRAFGGVSTIMGLATVNVLTSPHHLWFVFPGAFIFLGMLSHAGRLWADGVPLSQLFTRGTLAQEGQGQSAQAALPAASHVDALVRRLAPAHVLAGPHGLTVRRAAEDRASVEETLGRLAPAEREMIPDVLPTVISLAERVGSLATTLHGLDADVNAASVTSLDQRIATLKTEAGNEPSAEQERRIALLERQRATIAELMERRGTLAGQLESASLALHNLRLDLIKLRSSGLGNAMSDLTSATQEARAISREIGHAVDAVGEVRRL
jgi:hypothetical protein